MTRPVIERLTGEHLLDSFDSGVPVIDEWLRKYSRQSERVDSCVTYVAHVDRVVIGFHALVVGSIERSTAPAELTRRMPRYPVPVIVLARLGTDRAYRGQGLGRALVRDALVRCLAAADIAAAKAVVVDAKDGASGFYRRCGFTPYPNDPSRLYVSLATLRASV